MSSARNIVVYFNNNNKLENDINKTVFTDDAGKIFHFGKDHPIDGHYSDLVDKGSILVNWNNVSFVKFVEKKGEEDDRSEP